MGQRGKRASLVSQVQGVGKASLVHQDPWVRKETQAEMDSMGYPGGQVRRESLAFLGWTELRVWTDQEGYQGVDLEEILDQLAQVAQEASQVLLGHQERMALMALLEKEVHLVLLEVRVCLD